MTDAQLVSTFALGKNTSRDRELLKIIVLGAANVGKTSMMKRYTTDRFIADRRPTVGADFMTKKVKVEGTDVILQLWDTAGQVGTCIKLHFIPDLKFNFNGYNLNYFQERFHHGTLGQHFYRGSNGCLLVYDITDRASLSQLVDWRDEAIARVDSDHFFPIIVVGNKIDLKQDRNKVDQRQILEWCKLNTYGHVETSAKDGSGLEAAMQSIALLALEAKRNFVDLYDKVSTTSTRVIQLEGKYSESKRGEWYC